MTDVPTHKYTYLKRIKRSYVIPPHAYSLGILKRLAEARAFSSPPCTSTPSVQCLMRLINSLLCPVGELSRYYGKGIVTASLALSHG